ncbi:MAG: hypothetical protein BGO78_09330 [Chloroflexi bacterium 44-23]|nr:MAG: hypothetical protein BGO78_09330 [Chloroflexi bacterium 44-23]
MEIKPLLIYNPTAGQGNALKKLPGIKAILARYSFDYDLMLTDRPGAALPMAKEAAETGRSLIIAAGGDGTINEAINGIMTAELQGRARPTLAVLPVGRGNDFAFGIGIDKKIEHAVEILVAQKHSLIDIGFVTGGDSPNGRYFGNGVGVGFDTVVGIEAAKITWLHGISSYLVALIRTIFIYAHAPVYELKFDETTLQQPFLLISIMNGRRMGGSFMMAPQGQLGDGQFDLCLAGDVAQSRILPVAVKFISGTQEKDKSVTLARAKTISVTAVTGKIPVHADGETISTGCETLKVEILPAVLDVITNLEGAVA